MALLGVNCLSIANVVGSAFASTFPVPAPTTATRAPLGLPALSYASKNTFAASGLVTHTQSQLSRFSTSGNVAASSPGTASTSGSSTHRAPLAASRFISAPFLPRSRVHTTVLPSYDEAAAVASARRARGRARSARGDDLERSSARGRATTAVDMATRETRARRGRETRRVDRARTRRSRAPRCAAGRRTRGWLLRLVVVSFR